ncbi:hypothetical protein ES703_64180 [subsurface metagenome]
MDVFVVIIPGEKIPHKVEGAGDSVHLVSVNGTVHPHGRFVLMFSGRFGCDCDQNLVTAHPAFSDALDVGQVRVFLLHVMHDFGPLRIGVVPLPAQREIELTVVATRTLLQLCLGKGRNHTGCQQENTQD